jgi:hypothetical protein
MKISTPYFSSFKDTTYLPFVSLFVGLFLSVCLTEAAHSELEQDGHLIFGLDPSWRVGREFDKAFDGDSSTYYDYAYSTEGSYVGLDYGEAVFAVEIEFTARENYSERMVGGQFQGSNESTLAGFETLYTIESDPGQDAQVVVLETNQSYRYFRYLAPVNSYGNIAEFNVITKVDAVSVESLGTVVAESSELSEVEADESEVFISDSYSVVSYVDQNAVSFSLNLDQSGLVSAAIFDTSDRLIRTLLEAEPMEAGVHELAWDGLDRDGVAVVASDYVLKVLRGEGLEAEFITNLGINPDSAIYDTWVGNHDGAAAIAVDASGMYLCAQVTETAPVLLKQSLDGTSRHWTRIREEVTNGRYQGGVSLASNQNGTLYMLQQNGYLQVIDADDGTLRASWDVLPEGITREDTTYMHSLDQIGGADLAAYGDTVVLTYRDSGRIVWLDPSDGSVSTQFKLSQPHGVAVDSSGEAFVITAGRVLGIRTDGSARFVVIDGLNDPQRISIDPTTGNILVLDNYPGTQIKRFSQRGELLATYGQEEGRRYGYYEPNDFYAATDLTADGQGGFLIAEPQGVPRRVGHFDSNGLVKKQWFGGQPYYAWAEPDPRDPSKVWYFSGEGLVLTQIDLNSGEWDVLETYVPENMAGGLITQPSAHIGQWRVLYHNDQRYILCNSTAQVLAHSDGALRAVSVSSSDADELAYAVELAGWGASARSFRWLDGNGDGEPQAEEFTFSGYKVEPLVKTIGADFSLIGYDRGEVSLDVYQTEALWSPYGPYYPVGNEAGINVLVAAAPTTERAGVRGSGSYMDAEGNYYAHYNLESERHGTYWPTDWASVSRFVKMDTAGNELWSVGRHAVHGGLAGMHNTTYVETPEGQLHVPVKVIGELDTAIVLADRVENPALAWTKDGLYLGSLLQNRADDGLPDSVYSWYLTESGEDAITTSDNASGGRLIQHEDGSVYWFTQGRNNIPVYRINGWDDWERNDTPFTLETASTAAAATGTGLTLEYYNDTISGSPVASELSAQVWYGLSSDDTSLDDVIDGPYGAAGDWSQGPSELSRETNFAARWTGQVEAPLSEDFTFSIYNRGGVRLWINGYLVLNSWNQITERLESVPVRLVAGERYDIQLDFQTSQSNAALSLNWESRSLDRSRVPVGFFYPKTTAPVYTVLRDATAGIEAPSFESESGVMNDSFMDGYSVSGYRQWGFGTTGATLGYEAVDFGKGVSSIQVQASGSPASSNANFPVVVEFRLDSADGEVIASVPLDAALSTLSLPVSNIEGVHEVYAVNVTTTEWHSIDFRWFSFE